MKGSSVIMAQGLSSMYSDFPLKNDSLGIQDTSFISGYHYTVDIIDSTLQLFSNYKDDELIYEGFFKNSVPVGSHQMLDSNVLIIKNFHMGCQIGLETRFYLNKTIESYGEIECISADTLISDTLYVFNPTIGEDEMIIKRYDTLSVKKGTWRYYSQTGDLKREEFWEIGEKIRQENH